MGEITVLEIGDDLAVGFAGHLLAALGARVICVEPPEGHPARRLDAVWPALAAGKESVCLDLGDQEQWHRMARLASRCELILDGLHGATAPALRADLKRRLPLAEPPPVLMSVTPFGLTGRKSGWPSTPFVDYHAGGDAYFLPPGHNVESRAPVAGGDLSGQCEIGWSIAGTALAFTYGLRVGRNSAHRLVHLDISKQEVLLDLNRVELSRFANRGLRESRHTKAYETGGLFHARDGMVVIMPLEDHQWRKLYGLMGNPAWSQDDTYSTRAGRLQQAAQLQHHLQEWCFELSAADIYQRCQQAGVPTGIVKRPNEVFTWDQARARGFFQPARLGADRVCDVPWLPVPTVRAAAVTVPGIGACTEAVPSTGRQHDPQPGRDRHVPASLPLHGIRVLDFGTAWAGPHATEVLAFLGADVVKVESRQRLDLFRTMEGLETTPGFNEINLNKRSLALDLRHPRGIEIARRLLRVADILVDNFRPGVMDRLGLSYETVRALNPRAVMASLSSFGATGAESGYAGYAAIFCAMGGLAEMTGYPDWEPALVRSPMDLTAANATATLILSALLRREQTGTGTFLDISATEVIATLIPDALMRVAMGLAPPTRRGNDGWAGFQGCYPCRGEDRWIALALEDDATVRTVGGAIQRHLDDGIVPERHRGLLAQAGRSGVFHGLAAMLQRAAAAHAVLSAWTSWQEAWSLAEFLASRGIPAHPTSSPETEVNEEHLWSRHALARVHHSVQGDLVVLHAPWRVMDKSGGGRPALRPGPLFGAHTRAVLREWIEMPDEEFAALDTARVFA